MHIIKLQINISAIRFTILKTMKGKRRVALASESRRSVEVGAWLRVYSSSRSLLPEIIGQDVRRVKGKALIEADEGCFRVAEIGWYRVDVILAPISWGRGIFLSFLPQIIISINKSR